MNNICLYRCFHVFADTEWDAFLQSFYLTAAQGLLSMFVGRANNGTRTVWSNTKEHLVRVAAGMYVCVWCVCVCGNA